MSGLYLLAVVGIWVGLTWWLFKSWQRLRDRAPARRRVLNVLCLVVALIWICGSFWYGGGRKIYYDMQVDRMCRVDGGIKVYETARLSASEYDQYARSSWLFPEKANAKPTDKYYSETVRKYFREDDPKVSRRQYRVVRVGDGKVMGELTLYGRGGGDLPGPWHDSSYTCPDRATLPGLESSIFSRIDSQ